MVVNVNYTAFPTGDDPTLSLVWMSTNLPWLMPFLLLLIMISFTAGNFMYRERRNGRASLAESLAFGSTITMVGAIILNLIPGMFNPVVLATGFGFMALFVLWYLFTGGED